MFNTLQTSSRIVGGEDRLIDNVYAIIDSRIQYLEYQKEALVSNCLIDQIGHHSSDDSTPLPAPGFDTLLSSYERLQEKIAKMSRSVRLLLFIRSRVLRHNAQIILGLLTDCAYLNYSEEHLEQMLWSSRTLN